MKKLFFFILIVVFSLNGNQTINRFMQVKDKIQMNLKEVNEQVPFESIWSYIKNSTVLQTARIALGCYLLIRSTIDLGNYRTDAVYSYFSPTNLPAYSSKTRIYDRRDGTTFVLGAVLLSPEFQLVKNMIKKKLQM